MDFSARIYRVSGVIRSEVLSKDPAANLERRHVVLIKILMGAEVSLAQGFIPQLLKSDLTAKIRCNVCTISKRQTLKLYLYIYDS